jgi:hypothetical protein
MSAESIAAHGRAALLGPAGPLGQLVGLRGDEVAQPSRPPQTLGPETPAQRAHLAAARALDVGPMPESHGGSTDGRSPGVLATLGGVCDTLGFRTLRRLFSGAHRGELGAARGYGELEAGWLARSETSSAPGAAALHRERYTPRPLAPTDITIERGGSLPGGEIEQLSFASAAYSERPGARYQLTDQPQNARAYARCYRHTTPRADGQGRPALLWLHGWGMGFFSLEARVAQARWLYELGLDVYLVLLPYHGRRRPPGVVFAGDVFPNTNIARANEGFLQAIWECRSLIAHHRARGGGPVGAMGLSLGGYVAAALATFAPELHFTIPIVPCADVPTLMWSNGEGTAERRQAEAGGVNFEVFVRAMAVHAPLSHPLAIDRERVLLIGARGDRIIPPEHTRALHAHWGQPRLHWGEGSHLLPFGRGRTRDVVASWLREQRLL